MSKWTGPSHDHGSRGTPALYTATEAAEILKVKKSWIERQAAARKIPFTMLGGSYRFTDRHLATIILMHEMMPSPSGNLYDKRSRSRRTRNPASAAANGVAPLRPRPSNRQSGSGIPGPSAA
jgi:excisionase family DNA binding protein